MSPTPSRASRREGPDVVRGPIDTNFLLFAALSAAGQGGGGGCRPAARAACLPFAAPDAPLTLTVLAVATAAYLGLRLWSIAHDDGGMNWECPACGSHVEASNHCPKCGACHPGGCGTDHRSEDDGEEDWRHGFRVVDDDDEGDLPESEGEGVSRG